MPVRYSALLLLALAGACSSSEHATADSAAAAPGTAASATAAPSDSGMRHDSAGGMANAAGMQGMHADTIVERVRRDLAAMDAAPGDSITRLVPAHRQTVDALIADCETMMKQMKMDPPRKWRNAVADLRADLGKMGTANATAVRALWPEHKRRVEGMLAMRHDMMKM